MFRNVDWYLFADVAGQHVSPVFSSQAAKQLDP